MRPSLTRSGSSRDGVLRPTDVTQMFVQLESLTKRSGNDRRGHKAISRREPHSLSENCGPPVEGLVNQVGDQFLRQPTRSRPSGLKLLLLRPPPGGLRLATRKAALVMHRAPICANRVTMSPMLDRPFSKGM